MPPTSCTTASGRTSRPPCGRSRRRRTPARRRRRPRRSSTPRRWRRRTSPPTALIRAYRVGQTRFLRRCIEELLATSRTIPSDVLATLQIVESVSTRLDRVVEQVYAAYEQARELRLRDRSAVLTGRIRDLLRGKPVDIDGARDRARLPPSSDARGARRVGRRRRSRRARSAPPVHDGARRRRGMRGAAPVRRLGRDDRRGRGCRRGSTSRGRPSSSRSPRRT